MNELGTKENYPEHHTEFIGPKLSEVGYFATESDFVLESVMRAISRNAAGADLRDRIMDQQPGIADESLPYVDSFELPSPAEALFTRLTRENANLFEGSGLEYNGVPADHIGVGPVSAITEFVQVMAFNAGWNPLGAALTRAELANEIAFGRTLPEDMPDDDGASPSYGPNPGDDRLLDVRTLPVDGEYDLGDDQPPIRGSSEDD